MIGWLALSLGLLLALAAFHARHEAPLVRDLASWMPPLLAVAPATAPAPAAERFTRARGVVLGFDGISFEGIGPLLRRSELPELPGPDAERRLRLPGDAAVRDLAGRVGDDLDRAAPRAPRDRLPRALRAARRAPHAAPPAELPLTNSPMFVRRTLSQISHFGVVKQTPANAEHAGVARLWEVASRSGISVGVYHWLNTAPASARISPTR